MSVEKRREYIPENINLIEELAEVEQSGVAVIQRPRGEHPTVVGVAAVVKNYQGTVIAALGASTSKKEWDDGIDQGKFKNVVVKAASGLSFALGYAAGRLVLEGLKNE
jgi:DNA-binding IclR family transcriptional regulator